MRTRKAWIAFLLVVVTCGFAALSLTHGQEGPAPAATAQTSATAGARPEGGLSGRDLARLPFLQQQMYLSARRGGEWLRHANRPDGRFIKVLFAGRPSEKVLA